MQVTTSEIKWAISVVARCLVPPRRGIIGGNARMAKPLVLWQSHHHLIMRLPPPRDYLKFQIRPDIFFRFMASFSPTIQNGPKMSRFSISWKQAAFSSVYNGLDEKCLFWLPSSTLLACLSSRIGLQSREVFWDFLSGSAINLRKSRSSSITECG